MIDAFSGELSWPSAVVPVVPADTPNRFSWRVEAGRVLKLFLFRILGGKPNLSRN